MAGLTLPGEGDGYFHTWNQFTMRVADGRRDELRTVLGAAGIGSEIYYPITLDQQPCFKDLPEHASCDIEVSHRLAGECVSIPVYPEMTVVQQDHVIATVTEFLTLESTL